MSTIPEIDSLAVYVGDQRVGTLARARGGTVAFEYDAQWIINGYSISPLSLPLREGVFVAKRTPFEGLFGVFNDSLPDGWGRLLVDRMLRKQSIAPEHVDVITRLALVGDNGMGALRYEPAVSFDIQREHENFDRLADACQKVLDEQTTNDLDELYILGGSSGGARPKAHVCIDGDSWIVKFPTRQDGLDAGAIEYAYSKYAQNSGIRMPQTQLFPSERCAGYFAVKRFDREENAGNSSADRAHMISVSGLLATLHRLPNLDYDVLFKLVTKLTNSFADIEQLYRVMCFNVFAHNQDDHSKKFSFLCRNGAWELSPAYDLTYSTTYGNEHATTVNGAGRPSFEDVVHVGVRAGMSQQTVSQIAHEISDRCADLLRSIGKEA